MTLGDMDMRYELREIMVSPDQLLLDPNNPRLQHKARESKEFQVSELCDEELQSRVSKALHDKEHAVKRLVESIKENGFVNIDSIFVKSLPKVNKYLVLEGNRRTSAIRAILTNSAGVKASSLSSLQRIPVKELVCDDDLFATQMTDFILSIRHIFGVKEWAPMQKAHAVYNAYMRRLKQEEGIQKFRYIKPIADSVGRSMNLKPNEVSKAMAVYSIFSQLQDSGFDAKSDHYSLIEMCLSRPKMAQELFGFDRIGCQMSAEGADLFDQLCVETGCEISNPTKFRHLYNVWKEGSSREIQMVARGSLSVEDAAKSASNSSSQKDASRKLESALDSLKKIQVGTLRGTMKEKELAQNIKNLVETEIFPALFK